MRLPSSLALVGLALASGCANRSGSDSGAGACSGKNCSSNGSLVGSSTLSPGTIVDLDACAADVAQDAVDDTLGIVFDLEQSYHEMVACGGMAFTLGGALLTVVSQLVENPNRISRPGGFSFDRGIYSTAPAGNANVSMALHFVYGDDYVVGAENELVVYDLFDVQSYLLNPRLDIDYAAGKLLIRYDEVGPLVEMLGFGAEPNRPIRVNLDNLSRVGRELPKLKLKSTIEVDDPRAAGTVRYSLSSPPVRVSSLDDGGSLDMVIVSASAENPSIGQELETQRWEVEYLDGSGGLDGTIALSAAGGAFPFAVAFDYDRSGWPQTTLTCVE